MNDLEFIELLNLYLDHEISAADAARLEAEVQRNADRRQIYRQYCQMQKACAMLTEDFATETGDRQIVAFEQPARAAWRPAAWGIGGLVAAAACAAFVFNARTAPEISAPASPAVAVVEPPPAPPAVDPDARAITRTVALPMRRAELQPVLSTRALASDGNSGMIVTTSAAAPQFEWMAGVKLAPIPQTPTADELLRFDSRAAVKAGPAIYRSNRPIQGNVEMTAFQFQK